jgi:MoaA/NifB/PqqE/SkfB family radical SAM enzyme
MASNDAMRKAAMRIAELKSQGAPIKFSAYVYRHVAKWPDYKTRLVIGRVPDFDFIRCYAGRFMAFIDADGKVYPCVQLIDSFDALSFREAGIEKAWENCAKHTCKACYFPCFNELSKIFGLDPRVFISQIANILQGH